MSQVSTNWHFKSFLLRLIIILWSFLCWKYQHLVKKNKKHWKHSLMKLPIWCEGEGQWWKCDGVRDVFLQHNDGHLARSLWSIKTDYLHIFIYRQQVINAKRSISTSYNVLCLTLPLVSFMFICASTSLWILWILNPKKAHFKKSLNVMLLRVGKVCFFVEFIRKNIQRTSLYCQHGA